MFDSYRARELKTLYKAIVKKATYRLISMRKIIYEEPRSVSGLNHQNSIFKSFGIYQQTELKPVNSCACELVRIDMVEALFKLEEYGDEFKVFTN